MLDIKYIKIPLNIPYGTIILVDNNGHLMFGPKIVDEDLDEEEVSE